MDPRRCGRNVLTTGSGDEITAGTARVQCTPPQALVGTSDSPNLTTHQKLPQRLHHQSNTLLDLCVGNLEPKWPRLWLLLLLTRAFKECLCQQALRMYCAGALDGKEPFAIEGSENWRSTPDNLKEREKWPERPRKPLHRRHNRHS